jgi:hypothetical protein
MLKGIPIINQEGRAEVRDIDLERPFIIKASGTPGTCWLLLPDESDFRFSYIGLQELADEIFKVVRPVRPYKPISKQRGK